MKFILLFIIIFASPAMAQVFPYRSPDRSPVTATRDINTDNSEIHVIRKFDGNEYKVVPRGAKQDRQVAKSVPRESPQAQINRLKKELEKTRRELQALKGDLFREQAKQQQQVAPCPCQQQQQCPCKQSPVQHYVQTVPVVISPNHVYLLAGVGPDGVAMESTDKGTVVKLRDSPLVGLGYDRTFNEIWSAGIQGTRGISPDSSTYTAMFSFGWHF
jgi:hypothetical protein